MWRKAVGVLVLCMGLLVVGGGVAQASYSGANAKYYADLFAVNPNHGLPVYSDDCTNFVSQAMRYGGHPQVGTPVSGQVLHNDAEWWMTANGDGRTYSWSVANDFETFLSVYDLHADSGHTQYEGSQTLYVSLPITTGDPILYLWNNNTGTTFNHTSIMIGSGTDPTSGWVGTLVDEHTSNRYHAIWTLKPYNSQWATTTTTEFHIS